MKTVIIILAAGESARFGAIKQLQQFNSKTLLQHIIDEALDAHATVIVVTGAHAEKIQQSIRQKNIEIVFNNNWKTGIGSGIAAGVHYTIQHHADVSNIILAVCDQPFISSSLFKQLVQTHLQLKKNIVASAYGDTIGTPVLFTKKHFDVLLALPGDEGAKKILKSNNNDVATVSFPKGDIDIDTQNDYKALLNHESPT